MTWLNRNGSKRPRPNSIASRTRVVSGTLIPAKTIVSSFVVSVVVRWAEDASLQRGIIQQLHNLVIKIVRDRQRVLIRIGSQEADNLVVGQMSAVFTFSK